MQSFEIPVYLLSAEDVSGIEFSNIYVLQDEQNIDYLYILNTLHQQAKYRGQSTYWEAYHGFKQQFVKFNYSYASHTHVVQGTTYNNVYVNMKDIFSVKPTNLREKLQSLYTAITRARKKVVIYY